MLFGTKPSRVMDFVRPIFVLATLLFVGNFLMARLFGLYDDDFIFVMPAFTWSSSEAWSQITNAFRHWPQGRPVAFGLTYLLSYLSAQASSLGMGYLIGFAIILLNAFLLHQLARRFLSGPAALFAASVFVLYPADTSKVILMHRVFLHLNLTFLLLALLCYVSGKRWQAYLIAPLCFLTYEPVFMVFLMAPLLVRSLRELSWKRCVLHGMVCVASVLVLLVVRKNLGDERVGETFAQPLEVIQRIAQSLYIGPKTVLTTLVSRPFEALHATDALVWIAVLLCAGVFAAGSRVSDQGSDEAKSLQRVASIWIAGVGVIGLLLGYLICFRDDYWPPIMTIGRLSGYHAAGSVGAALMMGGLLGLVLDLYAKLRYWLIGGAALYCGLLVSFGIEVQRIDYVNHAEQQARFWRNIIETSGEWTPDTVVLVDISGNDSSRPFTPGMPLWWTVNFAPIMLDRLVQWPAEWGVNVKFPRVFGYLDNFETSSAGDAITVKSPPWLGPAYWPTIRNHEFIYFRFENGRMVRVTDPVLIGGREFLPKAWPEDSPPLLRTSQLYNTLFVRNSDWQTILGARNYPR